MISDCMQTTARGAKRQRYETREEEPAQPAVRVSKRQKAKAEAAAAAEQEAAAADRASGDEDDPFDGSATQVCSNHRSCLGIAWLPKFGNATECCKIESVFM